MNYTVKPTFIKIFTLSAALLGYLLRFLLYATAIDQKGLIIRGHWATWSLVSLTMLFFANPLLEKLDRIKLKYGMMEGENGL